MSTFPNALRAWRQSRRRSQFDLALVARVSQRHISFLESGKATPSRPMVLQLAAALELPLRAQNELLQAAGFAPMFSSEPLASEHLVPIHEALTHMLQHHEPLPALVVDRDWQLLHVNHGLMRLMTACGLDEARWQRICPDGQRHVMRLTLHPLGLRPYLENVDQVMHFIARRARREAALTQRDVCWRAIEDLLSAEALLEQSALPELPVMPLKLLIDGVSLQLFTTMTTFATPLDVTTDELCVESFYAMDEPTRQWFMQP